MAYASWSVVFGEQPSAAKWNILGTNDASFNNGTGIAAMEMGAVTAVKNDYKFSVYRNSAATVTTTGLTIAFDTKLFDTGTNFNTSTGTFTAPVAGFYAFSAAVGVAATASVTGLIVSLLKNSSEFERLGWNGNANAQAVLLNGSTLLQLSASDTINIQASTVGANAALQNGSTRTWFTGFLVSNT